jgi:hypothetical protein
MLLLVAEAEYICWPSDEASSARQLVKQTVQDVVTTETKLGLPQLVDSLSLQASSPAGLQDHRCLLLFSPILLCLPEKV